MQNLCRPPVVFANTYVFQLLHIEVTNCSLPQTLNKTVSQLSASDYTELTEDYETRCKQAYNSNCVIYCFGTTTAGNSICVEIRDFKPWLYVKVPEGESEFTMRVKIKKTLSRIPMDIIYENKYQLYGWEPESTENPTCRKQYKYARLFLNNSIQLRHAAKLLSAKGYAVYEEQVQVAQKFMTQCNIGATSWVSISTFVYQPESTRVSSCQIEVRGTFKNNVLMDETANMGNTCVKAIIAVVDIECDSYNCSSFPSAEVDPVIFIGTTFYRYGDNEPLCRVMLCLQDTLPPADGSIITRSYSCESELLVAWRDLIVLESDPDVIMSYNGTGFDFKYMYDRYQRNYPKQERFMQLGRLLAIRSSSIYTKKLQSAALGDNQLTYFETNGRFQLDLFQYIKKTYKLSNFSLDSVCAHFIPERPGKVKLELDGWLKGSVELVLATLLDAETFFVEGDKWSETEYSTIKEELKATLNSGNETALWNAMDNTKDKMLKRLSRTACKMSVETRILQPFRKAMDSCGENNYKKMFRLYREGAVGRGQIVKYCQVDCDLVVYLLVRLCVLPNIFKMSEVTYTLVDDIANRGQQIKVFNMIARFANSLGYVLNIIDVGWSTTNGYQGATVIEPTAGYYNTKIITLDFASLYPSIICGYNLCFSTLILNKEVLNNLPVLEEHGVVTDSYDLNGATWVFQQHSVGILPQILQRLLSSRKAVKSQLKNLQKGSMEYKLCDAEQLALKVSCNSVYGFTGVSLEMGMMSCMPVAVATTWNGRNMLEQTKQYIETHYKDKTVIYGDTDSVLINCGDISIAEAIREGKHMAEQITSIFRTSVLLEYEKVYYPYLLLKKKQYAGMKYEDNEFEKPSLEAKGIALVRRDNCPLLREIMKEVLFTVMYAADPHAAYEYVKTKLEALVDGNINIDKLVISNSLRTNYKNPKLPHVEVVNKMQARNAFDIPQPGDRVPYVIVAGKDQHIYARAEHPKFVLEHNLPIDTVYYLKNQLQSHLCRVMDPLPTPSMQFLFEQLIQRAQNKQLGVRRLPFTTHLYKPLESTSNNSIITSQAQAQAQTQAQALEKKNNTQNKKQKDLKVRTFLGKHKTISIEEYNKNRRVVRKKTATKTMVIEKKLQWK